MAAKRILVVDDEKNLTATLDKFFTSCGHSIYIANSGGEALKILKKQAIDLLILDLNMPGVDGVEVARAVKKNYPAAKVLILTAYAGEHKDKLASAKVEDIIAKPFGIFALINKVQELMGEKSELKPAPETLAKPGREAETKPNPVKVLFIDPAQSYILRDYVIPYIRLSWPEGIEIESVSPEPPSAVREKLIFFKPHIVFLSTALTRQAEELAKSIFNNIYTPREVVIYNSPDEKPAGADSAAAYYSAQKFLTDPEHLNRLSELIKEIALKHSLIDENAFRKKEPGAAGPPKEFTIDDIAGLVKEAISKELGLKEAELGDKASFVDELGVDSLKTIELSMAMEDTFGLELPDEDIPKLRTVGEAIEYVKKRVDLEELTRRKRLTRRILIVDDQKGMSDFLKNYFARKGYYATAAPEARTALELVKKEKPDVVLLDIRMPDIDGIEVLKSIKAESPPTKVIMVSVAEERKDEAQRCGADAFILKPFPVSYLEETVIKKIKELIKK